MIDREELDVVAAFRRQLDSLPEPRRRARRLIPVAVAAALVAAVALNVLASSSDSSRALAITRQDGWLELRIADLDAGAEQMTQELNDAGLPGRVYVVPVESKDVGTWVTVGETGWRRDNPPDFCNPTQRPTLRLQEIQNDKSTVRIPVARARETSGAFFLVAGRAADPGEAIVEVNKEGVYQLGDYPFGDRLREDLMGVTPTQLPNCERNRP